MLNAKLQDALNSQIQAEMASAYLYLAMAAHFEAENLPGMAGWVRIQAGEELGHAMKFYDFINQRDGRVILAAIEAPQAQWKTPLELFEHIYRHEQGVTAKIHALANLAAAEKDHATLAFLQWFVNEQVEEEASALAIVQKLRLAGDSGVAYLMLDEQLGQRPAAAQQTGAQA